MLFRICVVSCVTLVIASMLGCRFSDRPELGEVEGTVYLDGKPLDGAIVYFSPEGGGRVSQAMTDADGHYDLVYIGKDHGAKTGKHKVRITTAYEITDEKTGQPVYKPERVPSRYNSEQTELEAQVDGGGNTIDFQLLSK